MSRTINPINTSDTFQVWLQRTNDLVTELGTSIVTASSTGDTTYGNVTLVGTLSSNTINSSDIIRTGAIDVMIGNTSPLEIRSPVRFNNTTQTPVTITNSLGPRIKIQNTNISWLAGVRGSAGTGTDAEFVIGVEGSNFAFRIGTDGTIYANNIILDSDSSSPTGVVRSDRAIYTTTGVTGGGNLTANRTISLTGNALGLHNLATNGVVTRTAAGAIAARTIIGSTGIDVTNGDGVAGNPTISVDSDVVRASTTQTISGTKTFGTINATSGTITTLAGTTQTFTTSNVSTATIGTANVTTLNANGATVNTTVTVDRGAGAYFDAFVIKSGTPAAGNPYLFARKSTATEFIIGGHTGSALQGNLRFLFPSGVTCESNFYASGEIASYSDFRLKENITTIGNALSKVCAMRGVFFNKIGSESRSVGVIAQEMEAILPEVVFTADDEEKLKSVSYANIVGVLIEAVKELKAEIDELKQQR